MKKLFSFILVIMLAVTAISFAGCAQQNNIKLEGGPSLEEDVYGNGSFAVQKGDYVYFASGYVSTSDLGSAGLTNNLGEVKNGAIYRAKLETTQIEIDDSNEESGKKNVDSLTLSNPELLVSKLAGFEEAGLYIFGNKLFFATPSTSKTSSGTALYSQPVFYCVDLDGQNLTEIYSATEYNSGNFSFIAIDKEVYLLVYTGSEIIRIDLDGNVKVLATDVETAVLPSSKDIINNEYNATDIEKFVYYTKKSDKTTDTKDHGTTLNKANIVSGEESSLLAIDYVTIKLVKLENSKLYYTRNEVQSGSSVTSKSFLFVNDFSDEDFAKSECKFSYQSTISDAIRIDLEEKQGNIYVNGSKLIFKNDNGVVTTLTSSISDLLFVDGNYVYYVYSSALYRLDLTAENPSGVKLSDSETINTSYFDKTPDLIFFYVKNSTTSAYETYYVDLTNFIKDKTKPVKAN